jgi:predicted  nucleic acid-binding Zn-ribbon protein
MESATSAAQISALEHEITFAEQSISQLEDQELASLERSDSFEAEKTRLAGLLQSTTAALEAARARAAEVTSHNSAQITAIEAERSALRPRISENVLSNYDRIAKAKGTAVSEARDHKCSACQMMVRPQRWNDLSGRDPDSEFANTIFNCETCGRMLFYDPRRDAPIASPAIDKLHQAESP